MTSIWLLTLRQAPTGCGKSSRCCSKESLSMTNESRSLPSLTSVPRKLLTAFPLLVFSTHYPVTLTPKRVISKGIKIIHVQRNFKDICVSAFHHLKTFKLYGAETFEDFLPIMIGSYGIHFFCSWAEYVRGWERFTNDNPGDVLNIYFEDLKEDPVREIAKVDKFLETGQDEGMFKQIAEACHFTNMKKANKEIKENNFNTEVDMYRKGEVGDWKNWFTVAQSERVDQWLEENMLGSQLNFRDAL
ncbi:ST1A2-like protein [Mya arenaria]|uniref:ST1A2-like protein n=1 Tax=Mya arenaria TaxID=6604 RepID=A0ABY7FPX7_MYAAR|nr:ST1A2-like protein [Mya arenaria]